MKRPAFQFYAKDWRGNLKLRRCSDAAKGAWIEIMCVLHDSEEYGIARFPLKELVAAAGVQMKSARELVAKDVLKGGDRDVPAYTYTPRHAGKVGTPVTLIEASAGPVWYCSRFVRDEWIRGRRGESTRFTPDDQPPKAGPKPAPKGAPKPPNGERLGYGPAVAVASAVDSLNQHQVLVAGANAQPVDNPLGPKAHKSKPAAPRGSTAWETQLKAEGARHGLTPDTGETWPAFESRVRAARERAKHREERAA